MNTSGYPNLAHPDPKLVIPTRIHGPFRSILHCSPPPENGVRANQVYIIVSRGKNRSVSVEKFNSPQLTAVTHTGASPAIHVPGTQVLILVEWHVLWIDFFTSEIVNKVVIEYVSCLKLKLNSWIVNRYSHRLIFCIGTSIFSRASDKSPLVLYLPQPTATQSI